jgi:ABC-type multidrug transport system fused ATPase/permease subunit
MANETRVPSREETNVASIALRIVIALVAAGGSIPYVTLFWGVIMALATDTGNEFSRFAWLFPVAMIFAMLLAAMVVFVSVVFTRDRRLGNHVGNSRG